MLPWFDWALAACQFIFSSFSSSWRGANCCAHSKRAEAEIGKRLDDQKWWSLMETAKIQCYAFNAIRFDVVFLFFVFFFCVCIIQDMTASLTPTTSTAAFSKPPKGECQRQSYTLPGMPYWLGGWKIHVKGEGAWFIGKCVSVIHHTICQYCSVDCTMWIS